MALGSSRGGSSWTIFANLNNKNYQSGLREMGVATKQTTSEAEQGFTALNAVIAAGAAGLVAFGAAGVQAMRELRAEMLQVQYLFADMDRAGRMALEGQARNISGIAGIGENQAAQLMFRLASTGTGAGNLFREGLPIARAAAALRTDPQGLALASGQGANLADMSRTDYLNLLISTAGVSTSDISGLRALAPRALAGGKVAGLGGADTLGLLAYATQVSGSPEEASTGLTAVFAEAVKTDSKFGKKFAETFGESFVDAMDGRGAEGFIKALSRAFDEWGEIDFFGSFGRRAGMIASPLAQNPGFALRTVSAVQQGQSGALERVLENWEKELPHEFNLLRENINELRLSMVDGGEDSLKSALEKLNDILSDQDLQMVFENVGNIMGDLIFVMSELAVTSGALLKPLAALANVSVGVGGEASLLSIAGYGWAINRMHGWGRGNPNALSRMGGMAGGVGGGMLGGMAAGGGAGLGRLAMAGGRALPVAGQFLLADTLVKDLTGLSAVDEVNSMIRGAGEDIASALSDTANLLGFSNEKIENNIDLPPGVTYSDYIRSQSQWDPQALAKYPGLTQERLNQMRESGEISRVRPGGGLVAGTVGPWRDMNLGGDIPTTAFMTDIDYNLGLSGSEAWMGYGADDEARRTYSMWQDALSGSRSDALSFAMGYGSFEEMQKAFTAAFGEIDSHREEALWYKIERLWNRWIPEMTENTGRAADAAEDQCAAGSIGASYSEFDILRTRDG